MQFKEILAVSLMGLGTLYKHVHSFYPFENDGDGVVDCVEGKGLT